MTEQWQELKETITEMRDNGGTGTQQEVCKFLANYMKTLEKQMQESKWIPVKDPLNELPKDRMLYVTTKFGDVETLVYDMTEWDDADVARCTVAYMDYYLPEPYKAESEGE